MRKPSSRFVLSTVALLGVAACTIVACGDDDTSNGGGTSSGGTSDGGNDGASSSSGASGTSGTSGTGSSSSGTSGTSGTSGGPTDASNDTGASSSGDSGNDSGTDSGSDAGDSGVDSGVDSGPKDAGPDADSSTGTGGTCKIEDGTYLIHFTSVTGTPAGVCDAIKPADTTREINTKDANFDAGAKCTATYDFVACTQKLICNDSYSGGPVVGTIKSTVISDSKWTSTQITGKLHQTIEASIGASDCTFEYTMTKQ